MKGLKSLKKIKNAYIYSITLPYVLVCIIYIKPNIINIIQLN